MTFNTSDLPEAYSQSVDFARFQPCAPRMITPATNKVTYPLDGASERINGLPGKFTRWRFVLVSNSFRSSVPG